jgi:hypothetical protein
VIENEVQAILSGAADPPAALLTLVDEFRSGRDPQELLDLLYSTNDECIRVGAFITSEISTEKYESGRFVSRLHELTDHHDFSTRLYALNSLCPLLDPIDRDNLFARILTDIDTDAGDKVS